MATSETEDYLSKVDTVLVDLLGEVRLASTIVDHMRDCYQLDYLGRIAPRDDPEEQSLSVRRIFDWVARDPWKNDERVAQEGLSRIAPRLSLDQSHRWRVGLDTIVAVLLPRMAAHPQNAVVQRSGISILQTEVLHRSQKGGWLFVGTPSVVDQLVRSMMLHEDDREIQSKAVCALRKLFQQCSNHDRGRLIAFISRLVQAPEGVGQGIHALFRALHTFPSHHSIVDHGLSLLQRVDQFAHDEFLAYTQLHPEWRAIVADTPWEYRRFQRRASLLGVPLGDF